MKIATDKCKLDSAQNNANFFANYIVLSNEVVRLTPLKIADKPLFAKFTDNQAIWQYFAVKMHQEQDMNNYIDDAVEQRKLGLRYHFAIEDKKTGKVIGSTAFGNYSPKDNRIEIGWSWIDTAFQGSSINKNAKFALLHSAFEYLNMERVESKTDMLNARAKAALIKIGAIEEGCLRSHTLMPDARRRDTVYYSILKDEWNSQVKEKNFLNYHCDVKVLTEPCALSFKKEVDL